MITSDTLIYILLSVLSSVDFTHGLLCTCLCCRWYDAHNVEPLFPFGHGLSYTTFQFSNLIIKRGGMSGSSVANDVSHEETRSSSSPAIRVPSSAIRRFDSMLTITATVRNAGAISGTEIAQLYISYPEGLGEPLRQLRGVQVLHLEPGESGDATFVLSSRDLSIWDINAHAWALQCHPSNSSLTEVSSPEAGQESSCPFTFYVGASSRDFRLEGTVSVYEKI
jgi:beta-glucosidase